MANTLYDKGRQRFLSANINWLEETNISAYLIDTASYTPNFATHEFLSDVTEIARIKGPVQLTLLSRAASTGGAADAENITFTSVTGPSIEAIIIYAHRTAENDSPLIAYIDTATGLPITPNGGDIIVTWDNGANKIFKL